MEFGVRFEAPGGYSISIDSTEIGTRGVSKIRRECGIENLELDVIRGRKESFYRNVEMVVPEVLFKRLDSRGIPT